jgi:F-type H+-transporting ATPase subunit delta
VIDTTLAKRYAKALVEIGRENDALAKYGQDLDSITQLVELSKEFREILINPVFTKEDKKTIAGQILKKMGTDRMVINFVNVLIDRKRIDQLTGIEMAFRQKMDEIRGISRGEVVSAEPLDEDELGRITDALSNITGKQVLVTSKVDPFLIGGLVARVGDMVFDGSIRTQFDQLKESLRG